MLKRRCYHTVAAKKNQILQTITPVQSTQQALWVMCHSTIHLNACWVLVDVLLAKHCHINVLGSATSAVPVSAILSPERQFGRV